MSTKRGQKSGPEAATSNGKPAVKASPANAWNRPLKAKPAGPPPGMGPADKAKAKPKATTNGVDISPILRERLLHLSLTLVGHKVVLTQSNGAVLEGIFHTFTPFPNLSAEMKNKYVLNAVKTVKQPSSGQHNIKDGSTVIIPVDKVMYIQAKNVNLDRASANGTAKPAGDVMTDTQISGTKGDKDREFVAAGSAWTTTGGKSRADGLAGGLDDKGGMTRKGFGTARAAGLKGNIGEWDQFKANEELFNVQGTYDENLYTTELDKSQIDARKIKEAERMAKEIENTTSSNLHIAEERGHIVETDFDEEDRYSGVLTKDGKQRHASTPAKDSAPKKMNYAAAAAKADAKKKATPPGFAGKAAEKPTEKAAPVATDEKKEAPKKEADSEKKDKPKKVKPSEKESEPEKADGTAEEKKDKKEDGKEEDKDEGKDKPKSKLNANAKSFTFNPSAKSFTPSFGAPAPAPAEPQQQQPDQNAQMRGHPGMQPPHYMHPGPMGQPGMMPMMNPQFQQMRYPPQEGMYQHAQMQGHQPQHAQPASAPSSGPPAAEAPASATPPAPAPAGDDDAASQQQQQEDDASQQTAPQQQQPQQQQMPMQYNVPPPGAYFGAGGMAMHPRGPGYPPQFVGGPQQMPVTPGGGRYPMYPMQPGAMPPNMHMRGPGGAPYYPGPGGPVPYPGSGAYAGRGMMEEGYDGGRGRGGRGSGGRGRGRRGGRGRGRGGYNNNNYNGGNNSGRNTPQQQQGSSSDSGGANASDSQGKQSADGAK